MCWRALSHHMETHQHRHVALPPTARHPEVGTSRESKLGTQSWACTQKSARPKSMTRKRFNLPQKALVSGMGGRLEALLYVLYTHQRPLAG